MLRCDQPATGHLHRKAVAMALGRNIELIVKDTNIIVLNCWHKFQYHLDIL